MKFKTPTGRQSQNQKTFETLCKQCGISYDLARSLDDVKEIARRHGVK